MPPSYREPRGEHQREIITRRLFTPDSLTKGFSLPKENPFADCFLPSKEMPRGPPRKQISAVSQASSIRLAYRPVAAFVAALCPRANEDADESELPCSPFVRLAAVLLGRSLPNGWNVSKLITNIDSRRAQFHALLGSTYITESDY